MLRKINFFFSMHIIILVFMALINFYCSGQSSEKLNFNVLVNKYESLYDMKISDAYLDYIQKNLNNPELLKSIQNWTEENQIILNEDAKSILLIDYLINEKIFLDKGISIESLRLAEPYVIKNYLHSIKDINSEYIDPMGNKIYEALGYGPVISDVVPNIYGELSVTSLPDNADVYIDQKLCGCTIKDKEITWMLIVGEHSISVKKEGYIDCYADIIIKQIKPVQYHCDLEILK